MRLSDFIMLDEEGKKLAVLHQGILVAKRRSTTHLFFLFRMDHFYVETCCHIAEKCIKGYQMFNHHKLLEPYLDTIVIDDLLN